VKGFCEGIDCWGLEPVKIVWGPGLTVGALSPKRLFGALSP